MTLVFQHFHKSRQPAHTILSNMLEGYAYFRVLTDAHGKPVDLLLLETNDSFDAMAGLQRQEALGRRFTELFPDQGESDFDWIYFLGNVAVNGGVQQFRQHFTPLDRWLSVGAFSEEEGYLTLLLHDETMKKKLEDGMETEKRKHEVVLQAIPDTVLIINREGTLTDIKGSNRETLVPDGEKALGKSIHEIFQKETAVRLMLSVNRALATNQAQQDEIWIERDPRCCWYEAKTIPVDSREVVSSIRDITSRKESEQALMESERRWQYALEGNGDGVWDWDLNTGTVFLSERLKEMLEIKTDADSPTVERDVFFHCVDPLDRSRVEETMTEVLQNRLEMVDIEYRVRMKNGALRWMQARGKRMNHSTPKDQRRMVGTLADITERKLAEEEIKYLSFHDKLTGLYNRAYFEEEIRRLDTERQIPISIVIGDVNGLKLTNDIFGHLEGDKLLIEIGRIMMDSCRKEDVVARWGGDEFAMILPKTSESKAAEICQRITSGCEMVQNEYVQLSIALGHATKHHPETELHEVIKDAENQMYRNKLKTNKDNKGYMLSYLEEVLYQKTDETREHSERIREMGMKMAEYMDDHPDFNDIRLLGTFHDVGTIAVRNAILTKKERLTEEEWEEIKKHPDIGYRIAESIHEISHIADYILTHHEHWDGSGYPQGLKGDEIPKVSRMLAILDAYDVMTHDKEYRQSLSHEEAVDELRRCAGTQFDPSLVDLFIEFTENESTVRQEKTDAQ